MKPSLTLIAAVAKNRAIGKDNQLLWDLPEDMKHFRETTKGATVIMGRKTWESLPEKFRPLPGRNNIVISRQRDYAAPGALLADSVSAALAAAARFQVEAFVIGGADIYAQTLPLADRLILTAVDDSVSAADAFFPELAPQDWQETSRKPGRSRDANSAGPAFDFVTLIRRQAG